MLGDERKAREIALFRQGKFRDVKLARQQAAQAREHVRADGRRRGEDAAAASSRRTCRARRRRWSHALSRLSTDEVEVQVVHSGVGAIAESDVNLALASKSVIIGFNIRADVGSKQAGRVQGHRYPLLQHHLRRRGRGEGCAFRHARAGKAAKSILGMVEIRQVFKVLQGRHGRWLHGARRSDQARRARCALLRDNVVHLRRASSIRSNASRTMCVK